jgi:LPXTG-motif cell wall-anchored protein
MDIAPAAYLIPLAGLVAAAFLVFVLLRRRR